MITQLFNRLGSGVKKFKKAKSYLTSVIKGTDPQRDEQLTKRFEKENKEVSPKPDTFNSKIQSMEDSQGISGFSGSGYKGPGNVNHDKIMSNRARSM